MTIDEALSTLETAIQKVPPCYVRIEAIPNNNTKRIQVERSFAYELYHQWSDLLFGQNKSTNKNNAGLRLNGEISKDLDLKTRVYPDIILHAGQENITTQLLVCEIKRVDGSYPNSKQLHDDLEKLSKLLNLRLNNKEDAHFQCAALIVSNINKHDLELKLRDAINTTSEYIENIKADASKIYCLAVEVNDESHQLSVSKFKLTDIIH